jgi:putative zinc finger/helix-turn-helix YgiT family protein
MKSPVTGKEMLLAKEKRTLTFRKEEFEIVHHSYVCAESGESFTNSALDEININQLYNQYRVKYNIPFQEEIRRIREKYGLSALRMSEVLGMGANSYRNYEAGEIPNLSNARLIQLADDAEEFLKLLKISQVTDSKYLNKAEALVKSKTNNQPIRNIEQYLIDSTLPATETGYKTPDFKKITAMVVFFTESLQPWKTKMNKLLFYADFTHFSKTVFSISGARYQAIPLGPVPYNFQSIFEYLANKGIIEINYTQFGDGNTGEQFRPNPKVSFDATLFSEQELKTLEHTVERFRNTSTQEIIKISHLEKAWQENIAQCKIIDYRYGFQLNGAD